jgi:hypothetical protein
MDSDIVKCDSNIALDILQDRSVSSVLSVYPEAILDTFEWWLIDNRLLVALKPEGKKVEVHIACKFKDRHLVREAIQNGLQWLKLRGFSEAWTTAPDSRKALINMLANLDFVKVEDSTWALKLR